MDWITIGPNLMHLGNIEIYPQIILRLITRCDEEPISVLHLVNLLDHLRLETEMKQSKFVLATATSSVFSKKMEV